MVLDTLLEYGFFVVIAAIVVIKVIQVRWKVRRGDALFRTMFPELQPHLHPVKMLDFVVARLSRGKNPGGVWRNPPGFADGSARISMVEGREHVTLLDAAGTERARFIFEQHAEGGVLRVGKGKVTVNTRDINNQRVRYWHPDREFKWKRRGGVWSFTSRMAEREIESSDRTSFSNDSSSSYDSGSARTAAAAAGIVAAGGTFDGGGASAAWDGAGSAGGGTSSDTFEGSSASATAY
ncbi:MAG: hypothetical protein ABIR98_04420 [Usitatibacter sp.]